MQDYGPPTPVAKGVTGARPKLERTRATCDPRPSMRHESECAMKTRVCRASLSDAIL